MTTDTREALELARWVLDSCGPVPLAKNETIILTGLDARHQALAKALIAATEARPDHLDFCSFHDTMYAQPFCGYCGIPTGHG